MTFTVKLGPATPSLQERDEDAIIKNSDPAFTSEGSGESVTDSDVVIDAISPEAIDESLATPLSIRELLDLIHLTLNEAKETSIHKDRDKILGKLQGAAELLSANL